MGHYTHSTRYGIRWDLSLSLLKKTQINLIQFILKKRNKKAKHSDPCAWPHAFKASRLETRFLFTWIRLMRC